MGWAGSLILFFTVSSSEAGVAGAIVVYPTNSSIEIGNNALYNVAGRQFTAYVPISPNTIDWLVNGVVGGNATVGKITATGVYSPPAAIPVVNVVTVSARSKAYPTSIGSTSLTITRNVPHLWGVSPSKFPAGAYQVALNGSNFAPDSYVTANGAKVATTYVSPTSVKATGSAVAGSSIVFQVNQPAPGAVAGEKVTAQVTSAVPVTVAVAPTSAGVQLGKSQLFTATVAGSTNTAVTWAVNGVTGGSTVAGTITSSGLYTAPAVLPSPATATIKATSVASPTSTGQATVMLSAPEVIVKVSVTPSAASVQYGKTQSFSAAVSNATSTAVTWSVNGSVGGSATVGTITAAGVYTAPSAPPSSSSSTVTVRATSVASPGVSGQAVVTLTTAAPPPTSLAAARFLEQSSFGPTPATLDALSKSDVATCLQQQFAMPESPLFVPTNNSMGQLQEWMLYNYTTAPDQLRQRVAYSLSQIVVTSANKLIYADEILPWLRLLSKHAFGNYRTLLREVSVSPSMGKYLDLANSRRPGLAGGANENYPRELMQLFTIGLWKLNQDGSQVLDASQQPIPTYNQQTVAQVALALTGWTYAAAPGSVSYSMGNNEYFGAPMETRPGNHDTSQKTILGVTVPAGQSVEQDLDSVLDILFNHPNTPPFIATRLIRSLVTSNPSPAYIKRVADVFADNGSGVRGDLKAVVTAILLDAEARNDTPTLTGGRLKEPILQVSNLLRALNGAYKPVHQLTYLYDNLAQMPLGPPSVFSWFSPLYHVPSSPLFGPEFQIYTPSQATFRGNLMYYLLSSPGSSATIDLTPFQAYGNDMPGLVEAVNQKLLYGRMDEDMKQVLINAATPGYDAQARILTVLYLTALSGQYAVQY